MVSIKDKELYAIAAQEVANGVTDTGLLAKSFADSGGNSAQAEALYLKMRVLDLSSQRDAQQKQLQQQARIQKQQSIEQQKQQALYAGQQKKIKEDADWAAMAWWKKILLYIAMYAFLIYILCHLPESFYSFIRNIKGNS